MNKAVCAEYFVRQQRLEAIGWMRLIGRYFRRCSAILFGNGNELCKNF